MCYGDMTPKPFVWVEGYDVPWPYNAVEKRCRNYDDLLSWGHQRSMPRDAFRALNRNDSSYEWTYYP